MIGPDCKRAWRFRWAAGWLAVALLPAQSAPVPAGGQVEPVSGGTPSFGVAVVDNAGLQGKVYLLRPGTRKLPNFHRLKPKGTLYTASLNIPPRDFADGFPGITDRYEWFAIDYTGRFWIEQPGAYRFALMSDDGSKLYIDGRLEIDNDGLHSVIGRQRSVPLSRGIHQIRVSYFQGPRYHLSLVLQVAPPGQEWRVFSTREFRPPGDTALRSK